MPVPPMLPRLKLVAIKKKDIDHTARSIDFDFVGEFEMRKNDEKWINSSFMHCKNAIISYIIVERFVSQSWPALAVETIQ